MLEVESDLELVVQPDLIDLSYVGASLAIDMKSFVKTTKMKWFLIFDNKLFTQNSVRRNYDGTETTSYWICSECENGRLILNHFDAIVKRSKICNLNCIASISNILRKVARQEMLQNYATNVSLSRSQVYNNVRLNMENQDFSSTLPDFGKKHFG